MLEAPHVRPACDNQFMMRDRIVGVSVPRKEGRDKVTGQAQYIDDMTLPDMLYGATVRSQIPRGKIKNITLRARNRLGRICRCVRERYSREKLHRADRRRSALPGGWDRQPSRGADSAAGPSRPARSSEGGCGGLDRIRSASCRVHHGRERELLRNHLGSGQYLQNAI